MNPAPLPQTGVCLHCDTPVEGADYCCGGCELAAAIIRGAGLSRYYDEREAPGNRPLPSDERWSAVTVAQAPDGGVCAQVQIDGLRCGSCVWVTERVLEQTDGVLAAQVSYATGRASLRWDPEVTTLEALAGRVSAVGYQARPLDSVGDAGGFDRDLLTRLGVASFVAANVMGLSVGLYLGWFSGIDDRYAALFRWGSLALATPAALWCAEPFYRGALTGLRHRILHMDLPISLGVVLLYGHGVAATLDGREGYLDSMTMLVALLLAGRVVEQRGRKRAAEAARALAARAPRSARRVAAGAVERISVEHIAVGDRLALGMGEEAAADGRVLSGAGLLRRTLLTGESAPEPIAPGDLVIAGAVLEDGAVEFVVVAAGDQTLLARMADGLARAQAAPPPPALADRVAPWFTGVVLALAGLGWAGWYLAAGPEVALEVAIAVLVVACPCALALSTPLAVAAGLGACARRGLLLKSGDALLRMARVDRVALDKTGTLTLGAPTVVSAEDEVLQLAASLERSSIHPVARAIVDEASRRGLPIFANSQTQETPGVGIRGVVNGRSWALQRGGPGEVVLLDDERIHGRILLDDQLREDAVAAVETLSALGLKLTLLTGDHPAVAARIAALAGVDAVEAGLSPQEKVDRIEALQRQGERVLFVGDGLNDGLALTAADLGIAMGSGAASSVLASDGVITNDSLTPLLAGLHAARATEQAVAHNLLRSLLYNGFAVTAALAGWVNPLIAALLMPLSSALVLWGASRVEAEVRAAME